MASLEIARLFIGVNRMIFRTKKTLENLHFWVGGISGEIYVGVRDKNGGIKERTIVTEKVLNVARDYEEGLDHKGK